MAFATFEAADACLPVSMLHDTFDTFPQYMSVTVKDLKPGVIS